jgi:RimJ/RimL family protein N-acetyltransferase
MLLLTAASGKIYYMQLTHSKGTRSSGTQEDEVQKGKEGQDEYRELVLADGTSVLVREIQPTDAPALQRLVGRLSERSIRLRFFGPLEELSDRKAQYFAEVDGKDRYALVALDPQDEEIVAVVRFDREEGTDRAEYAVLVEDRFQGRGLGFGLTRALIEAARERDVRSFDALVLPENRGMIRLLHDLDLPEHMRREEGVRHYFISLSPEGVETTNT